MWNVSPGALQATEWPRYGLVKYYINRNFNTVHHFQSQIVFTQAESFIGSRDCIILTQIGLPSQEKITHDYVHVLSNFVLRLKCVLSNVHMSARMFAFARILAFKALSFKMKDGAKGFLGCGIIESTMADAEIRTLHSRNRNTAILSMNFKLKLAIMRCHWKGKMLFLCLHLRRWIDHKNHANTEKRWTCPLHTCICCVFISCCDCINGWGAKFLAQ